MWLHPDPAQALNFAVRFSALAQLIGLLELSFARKELAPDGFLDWSLIGLLSPRTQTRVGSLFRRSFGRLSSRAVVVIAVLDAVVAGTLLLWPSVLFLIALAAAIQMILMKRHHLTVDGSDQMLLMVLLVCLLGRIGNEAVTNRAAVSFLAAELTLAYLVAGFSKAASGYWRSGDAITMIVQTRMYGQPKAARAVADHPSIGCVAAYAVICWESVFLLCVTAPPVVVILLLAMGVGFHLGCAIVMGLNRFLWAFVASYPSLMCTNFAIRAALGDHAANMVTIAVATVVALSLASLGIPRTALRPEALAGQQGQSRPPADSERCPDGA
jgi:hypothetical protein